MVLQKFSLGRWFQRYLEDRRPADSACFHWINVFHMILNCGQNLLMAYIIENWCAFCLFSHCMIANGCVHSLFCCKRVWNVFFFPFKFVQSLGKFPMQLRSCFSVSMCFVTTLLCVCCVPLGFNPIETELLLFDHFVVRIYDALSIGYESCRIISYTSLLCVKYVALPCPWCVQLSMPYLGIIGQNAISSYFKNGSVGKEIR